MFEGHEHIYCVIDDMLHRYDCLDDDVFYFRKQNFVIVPHELDFSPESTQALLAALVVLGRVLILLKGCIVLV